VTPGTTTKAAVGMGAATAVSRVLGFVRVLIVAGVLGTTYLGNAFQSANSLSNVLFELLAAGALSAVLVPMFVELLDRDDEAGAERLAGAVLGTALLALGAVSLVGVIAAPLLARVLTAGVPADILEAQRDLTTHLLRFFVPQLLLYAVGTVATAVLHAKRRFAVTAIAPIGNTVVMVAALVGLRALTGPDPGLDLSSAERWLLVIAGTGGVLGFVAVLVIACEATGFSLRPRLPRREPAVRDALRHSGWGAVLHSGSGLLLGGAIVAGAAVEGGVVAYQVGWVFFLAPYAVLAQPIHTTILPELVREADQPEVFASSVRWALERMALLVLPVAAALAVLAWPALRVVAIGETGPEGAGLIAAAIAGLAAGLLPYGAFLLLARGFYALGDSRTPGLVALVTAGVGVVVMVVGALVSNGEARVAVLGLGHSVAFALGALWLGVLLGHRLDRSLAPRALGRIALVVAVAGAAGLGAVRALGEDPSRAVDVLACAVGAGAIGGIVLIGYRALGVQRSLTVRA
jgi:putative peptidoglycan lipid II flippase